MKPTLPSQVEAIDRAIETLALAGLVVLIVALAWVP